MEPMQHQLSAILFSDIVGYSAIMSRDENEAWNILQRAKGIHLDLAEKYKGQLLKELGDGFLLRFQSVIDAVHFAKDLISEVSEDKSLGFHVGIHMGDVIVKEGDVFGEGVNIAARLEEEATDNEVIISEAVYQNIKNQPDIEAELIGKTHLKNIEGLVTVYKLTDGKGHSNKKRSSNKLVVSFILVVFAIFLVYAFSEFGKSSSAIIEPSIAVLPFENLSNDPEQEYFSDGVSDEIRTKLGFIKGLTVRGRSSSVYFKNKPLPLNDISEALNVHYVLEGSIRSFNNRASLNLSLVDVENDVVILPIQIERDIDDIFEVQAEIAKMVAVELEAVLLPGEERRIEKKPTENLDAHKHYLLGRYYHLYGQSKDIIRLSLSNLDKAIELDSTFAEPYALKARVLLTMAGWGYETPFKAAINAKPFAQKALELDPDISESHVAMASVHFYLLQFDKAYEEIEKAIDLDPENDLNYLLLWNISMLTKDYDIALEAARKARKLNPFSAVNDAQVGNTYFVMGELDSAILDLEKSLERFPDSNHGKWLLGNCYLAKQEYERAVKYYLDRSHPTRYVNWTLGYTYAKMGELDSAQKVLKYLIHKYDTAYAPPSQIGLIYYGLGNGDSTYYWMKKAHEIHDWYIPRFIPLFDELINEPPYNEWYGLND